MWNFQLLNFYLLFKEGCLADHMVFLCLHFLRYTMKGLDEIHLLF